MTEAEWLECEDWQPMLAFLSNRLSQRKAMLYVCAGLRSIWHLLYDDGSQDAVEVAEQAADGLASADEVRDAGHYAEAPTFGYDRESEDAQLLNASHIAYHVLDGQLHWHLLEHLSSQKEWPGGHLVREVFGNPFRIVTIDPAWLTWNDATVVRLAQAAYDERILPAGLLGDTRLAVLADALEEAGCADEQLRGHLRSGGEHYRGCFVLDVLLGKS